MKTFYVIESDGVFKIGHTSDTTRRCSELQTGNPHQVILRYTVETDDQTAKALESHWHNHFGDKRIAGEWYGLSEPDLQKIERQSAILFPASRRPRCTRHQPKQPEKAATQKKDPLWVCSAPNVFRYTVTGVYYVFVKRGTTRFRRSLKTTDFDLAKRKAADFLGSVGTLKNDEDATLPFDQIGDQWLSWHSHSLSPGSVMRKMACLKNLASHFNGSPIKKVGFNDVHVWAVKRRDQVASSTFNHELEVLNGVLGYAAKRGLIISNPASDLKRARLNREEADIPSKEEFKKLVDTIRSRKHTSNGGETEAPLAGAEDAADFIELLAYSGCRQAEGNSLRWCDVDFTNRRLTINGTKTASSRRTIPMSNALTELLQRIRASRQDAEPTETISNIKSARKAFRYACKKLFGDPERFMHHSCRHFFVSTCIECGIDIPTISRWVGHSDGSKLVMTVYGHLRAAHSDAMVNRLNF